MSAEVAATDAATGAEPGPPARPRRPRVTRRRVLVALLLLVAAAGAAGAVVLGFVVRSADVETADRTEIVGVADSVAGRMVSLTADNARANVDAMLELSTGPFRDQLSKLATTFGTLLRQGQVVADGRVDSTGVESVGDGRATVLTSASVMVRNTEVPNGAPREYRLVVDLQEVDGRWLVSGLDVAP